MYNNSLKSCSTIRELVSYGESLPISNDKLHFKTVIETKTDKIVINISGIFDKYYLLLKDKAVRLELSDKEFSKYKYQPKLLCYDIYDGSTELTPLILRINNMLSVTEFTKKEILMFKKDIFGFLNELITLEQDNIDINISEIENKIRE